MEGQTTARQYHEIAARLLACAPNAKHVVLPGVGHAIPFDAPDAMARAVLAFLAE